ncbi:MAG: protein kinase, partial [Planctomycetes bacterium]|nr:protein kinase [Planctomycetota bacterium]
MQPQAHPPFPTQPPAGGPTFIGPYRVVAALGAGGVGQVLRVEDAIGRQLALKLLGNPGSRAKEVRFAREGEVTASLNHPGIVKVHGWGNSEAGPYLVYELIEGEDLEACFRRLSREQLLDVILQVADALGYAHAQGVIHRDVKPGNVLVAPGGRAYLADFGLAQAAGLERLTLSGAMVGTPHYMSPEQALGQREHYGPPTDVWALGVMLYRVLTGREPFSGSSMMMLLAQVTSEPPEDPRASDADLPRGLVEVCMRALQKDPARRYADGAAFAEDLRRALGGDSVIGRKPLLVARRRRTARALGVALLLLAALGAGVYALVTRETVAPSVDAPAPPELSRTEQLDAEKLDTQREQLARVLETFERGAAEDGRAQLERLRVLAQADPQRERALWGEGLAALGALESPAALGRQLPLLEVLAGLSPAGQEAQSEDGFRVTRLAVEFAANRLDLGNEARLQGDEAADREALQACRELLELLGRCGWRLRERVPGERILEGVLLRWKVEAIAEDTYWWIMLSALRLDFRIYPFGAFMDPSGRTPAPERVWPWSSGTRDPWKRFFQLRMRLEIFPTESRAALAAPLRDPESWSETPWALGPRQWASAAICFAANRPGPEAIELLQAAIERDPESPEGYFGLAQRLQALGRNEEAAEQGALGLERFERCYDRDLMRRNKYPDLLLAQLRLLCRLDRRDEARRIH